ncbi:MAG: hypothetical protein AB1640_13025 [bacterium]
MKPPKRHIIDGRVSRVYEKGGILLSEPGETLEILSEGAIRDGAPEAARISTCLLCGKPAVCWGLFMTASEILTYTEYPKGGATGTFFGLCNEHDPYDKEDEVCDAAYKVLEAQSHVEEELQAAMDAVDSWLERLSKEGLSEGESLKVVLSKVKKDELVAGFHFSQDVRTALELALMDELKRGHN